MFTKSLLFSSVRLLSVVAALLLSSRAAYGQTEKEIAAKLEKAFHIVDLDDDGNVECIALRDTDDLFIQSIDFSLLTHLRILNIDPKEEGAVTDRSLVHLQKKGPKNLVHFRGGRGVRFSGKELGQFLKAHSSVTCLTLRGRENTNDTLKALTEGKNLTDLTLYDTDITDEGLKELNRCEQLTYLCLDSSRKVSDAGLAHVLKLSNLVTLRLRGTSVTDKGFATLGALINLSDLYILSKKMSNEVRENLQLNLPDLLIHEE